ncbi:unnamed protein product [Candidula unifasciata]|uniref:Mitochondrial fission factor n=1 Tax=Candidula unifasciata TaxID=100452 RepID=A0A8S3ZB10_9EUPU|nr:unnamed protein product [Candidula unifasciata]
MNGNQEEGHIKLPDHTQPSDYLDIHSKTYDPEFISQISSRMQVPDRIAVGGSEYSGKQNGFIHQEFPANAQFVGMTVPDRIILAGDNLHIALKQDLILDLPGNSPAASESLSSYIGMITPPRTLTLEERFPVVEETDDHKMMAARGNMAVRDAKINNSHLNGPVPYDPGVNLHDSVLLNEENETTLLRTQVAKLTRRVQVIEEDNQKRATRELVMYPLILGYFMWKILSWLTRDR